MHSLIIRPARFSLLPSGCRLYRRRRSPRRRRRLWNGKRHWNIHSLGVRAQHLCARKSHKAGHLELNDGADGWNHRSWRGTCQGHVLCFSTGSKAQHGRRWDGPVVVKGGIVVVQTHGGVQSEVLRLHAGRDLVRGVYQADGQCCRRRTCGG